MHTNATTPGHERSGEGCSTSDRIMHGIVTAQNKPMLSVCTGCIFFACCSTHGHAVDIFHSQYATGRVTDQWHCMHATVVIVIRL